MPMARAAHLVVFDGRRLQSPWEAPHDLLHGSTGVGACCMLGGGANNGEGSKRPG